MPRSGPLNVCRHPIPLQPPPPPQSGQNFSIGITQIMDQPNAMQKSLYYAFFELGDVHSPSLLHQPGLWVCSDIGWECGSKRPKRGQHITATIFIISIFFWTESSLWQCWRGPHHHVVRWPVAVTTDESLLSLITSGPFTNYVASKTFKITSIIFEKIAWESLTPRTAYLISLHACCQVAVLHGLAWSRIRRIWPHPRSSWKLLSTDFYVNSVR